MLRWGWVLACASAVACADPVGSGHGDSDIGPMDLASPDLARFDARAELDRGAEGPDLDLGDEGAVEPEDDPLADPAPDSMRDRGCVWQGGFRDDEPRADYEGLDVIWLPPPCEGSRHQTLDLAKIGRVVFVGDGVLLDIPPVARPQESEYATLRGWLTTLLVKRADLRHPPVRPPHDWYRPHAGVVPENHLENFSLCAHSGASWRDLHGSFHEHAPADRPADPGGGRPVDAGVLRAAAGLSPTCFDKVHDRITREAAQGKMTLVLVAFGHYDDDALERDLDWIDNGGPATLADGAVESVEALADFLRADVGDDVVVVVANVPAWRAGVGAGEICPAHRIEGSTRQISEVNEALAAASHRRSPFFDVVLLDEYVRSRGATCVERRTELMMGDDGAGCGVLPEDGAQLDEERVFRSSLPFDAVSSCCWTGLARPHDELSCDRPDRDGHLAFALLFEEVIDAIATPP